MLKCAVLVWTALFVAGEALTVGVVLPFSSFGSRVRAYQKELDTTWNQIVKNVRFTPLQLWRGIKFETVMWPVIPPPAKILETLCEHLLPKNVSVIIYVTDSEFFKGDVVAAQYFLQLSNYMGLPIIAWNAANVGLEKRLPNSIILQLAPTVGHQADLMLAILIRYEWRQFCVVTSVINGHQDFLKALQEGLRQLNSVNYNFKLEMLLSRSLNVLEMEDMVTKLADLMDTESGCRIFLLYSTNVEARTIFRAADHLRLTGKEFLWIVSQSVVASADYTPEFPVGLLGVQFDTDETGVLNACSNAIRVLGRGLQMYMAQFPHNYTDNLNGNLSCQLNHSTWQHGATLHRHLKNVVISSKNGDDVLEFDEDGTLKRSTLKIVNLDTQRQWQTIGLWSKNSLLIQDVVWPGGAHIPPRGKPERFHLKVTFLEEPPYLNMEMPDSETGRCRTPSAELCTVPAVPHGYDQTGVAGNRSHQRCCSGFCIDLLQKLSRDLEFTYDLKRVEDGLWGTETSGKWNGLVAELLEHKADMVMTSLKINSQRETAVDFSIPFLDTGIAIVVAKRTGIISPHAFLQPFDSFTWLVITVVSIQAGALSIFLFEWLSPAGINMKSAPPKGHNFTILQTYWMAWAMLFKAPVKIVGPKGSTARFMANVWAGFAVVFIAIYTANLAVFMITREIYYDFTGVEDERLSHPMSQDPPFKYGTIPFGNTEAIIRNNFQQMYLYMRKYNRSTVFEGIQAVKSGELDAFIYDATVLDYLTAQDDDCRLLTVGSWYSMTGYGVAFPKNSKYRDLFSQQILDYKQTGELEQWQKFWLSGACRIKQSDSNGQLQGFSHQPLSLMQFISAFVLLGLGITVAFVIFLLEHCYFCYVSSRKRTIAYSSTKWWPLISHNLCRVMAGKRTKVGGAKCSNPRCEVQLWKVQHQLDVSQLRIEQLQREIDEIQRHFVQETYL